MTPKAVCLCSGGLDSTVAATKALNDGFEISIFHVLYGQKAEEREKRAIRGSVVVPWVGRNLIRKGTFRTRGTSARTSS